MTSICIKIVIIMDSSITSIAILTLTKMTMQLQSPLLLLQSFAFSQVWKKG